MATSVIKKYLDADLTLYNINSIGFSCQNDGRIQIRFVSGSTWRVITFGENGVISETKSTDGGKTFSTLWSK